MKKYILTPTLLLLCAMCTGQTGSPQVFATGGGEGASATRQISWTIGEPITTTQTSGSYMVAQGYQQPWAEVITDLDELEAKTAEVRVFPNPTAHTLHIVYAGDRARGDHFELLDVQGRTLQRTRLTEASTDVDMSTYGNGSYFLRLLDAEGKPQRTFTINLVQ